MTSSSAVSLLLNMGDGLLSDDLGIKFICTFNENIQNIDDALLRKGRLACKYEFTELCTEKSNALLAEIYADRDPVPTTNKPMSLADIYNIDGEAYVNTKKTIITLLSAFLSLLNVSQNYLASFFLKKRINTTSS